MQEPCLINIKFRKSDRQFNLKYANIALILYNFIEKFFDINLHQASNRL